MPRPTNAAARRTAAVGVALLAGCAQATVREPAARATAAAAGEVASAPRGAAFRPIGIDELSGAGDPLARPAAALRSLVPTAIPAAGTPATVPHTAAPVQLFRGSYTGRTHGQRGALALVLRPDDAGAVRGTLAWRVTIDRGALAPWTAARDSVLLVRVPIVAAARDADRLVLRLDAYFDPACNCTARATFHAAVRGDTLVGRFTVDGPATLVGEERGHWRAVRVAP